MRRAISPQERLKLIPFQPQKTSSDLGWSSITLEDYKYLPPSSLSIAPMDHHIIAFHYKPPPGRLFHRCGSKNSEDIMQVNDVTYVPANVDNHWAFGDGAPHCLHILVDHCFMTRTALTTCDIDITRAEFQDSFQSRDSQLPTFAKLFQAELAGGGCNGPLYAESLGTALAVYLLNNYCNIRLHKKTGSEQLSKHDLQRTLYFIHDRLEENISLQEMADNLAMSTYYFVRRFRQTMGCAPYQYVLRLKLEKARDLLLSQPVSPISSIAHQLGFSDHTHFTRQFRAKFALTPSKYRARYQ